MKKKKFHGAIALLLCCCLTGCGNTTRAIRSTLQVNDDIYDNTDDDGYALAGSAGAFNPAMTEEAFYDEVTDKAYEAEPDYDNVQTPDQDETVPGASEEGQEDLKAEKLVFTGSLTVETTDFSATLARIRQSVTDLGGFIESEDESDDAYGWYMDDYRKSSSTLRAYIHARIPSPGFYEFMDGIEGEQAKITNRSVNVQNISRQYSETATTIESYEIQEARLLEMMKEATRVSDMLEIENRLSEVQRSLKQYKNTLSGMDTDVAYSTVSISLREVGIYSRPEVTSFTEKIRNAFTDGWAGFVGGLQIFSIWFVGNIFGILLFFVILWVLYRIIKGIFRQRRKRKNKIGNQKGSAGNVAQPKQSDLSDETEMKEKNSKE